MAEKTVRICDRDGKEVKEGVGDTAGGPVIIKFPGYSEELMVCAGCMASLQRWTKGAGKRTFAGAAKGLEERLLRLPVDE